MVGVKSRGKMIKRILKVQTPLMKGEDVLYFQKSLDSLGFKVGQIDGIYGNLSRAACLEFQTKVGLRVDGICGALTWAAIGNALKNDSNSQKEVLERLEVWGFGPMIQVKGLSYSTKQFQAALGLAVDGIIGPATSKALMGNPIVPRIPEEEIKCQCNTYCNGTPVGEVSIGVRIFAERVFREVEKRYPNTKFFISNRKSPPPDGAIAGGYRCEKWNRERGGAKGSKHVECIAMDIYGIHPSVDQKIIRKYIEDIAMRLNTKGGVGYGARYIVHIDMRGVKSRWKY